MPSLWTLLVRPTTACILLGFLAVRTSGYFIIDEPAAQRQWVNNAANLVSWSKGLLDGIEGFDVEMARMSTDGLTLVARNVPAKPPQLNIMLQDVPAGDDYFLIFLNSTHGLMYATSPRFSILAASASPSSSPPSPAANVPTITISGSPNPTQHFATTFPALVSGAWKTSVGVGTPQLLAIMMTIVGCVFGALWTVGGY